MHNLNLKNTLLLDFPFGTVDGNLPANAEDVGSVTGPGRFQTPCSGQLGLCTTTTEPTLQSPGAETTEAHMLKSLCSATREVTTVRKDMQGRVAPAGSNQRKPMHNIDDPAQLKLTK